MPFLVPSRSFCGASSKTGFDWPTLRPRADISIVGLTPGTQFVQRLGLYDTVLSYDAIEQLEAVPNVYVDMSGNQYWRVHHHLRDNLTNSCGVA